MIQHLCHLIIQEPGQNFLNSQYDIGKTTMSRHSTLKPLEIIFLSVLL